MLITPSGLNPFFQNLRMDFQSSLVSQVTFWDKVATKIVSTSEQTVYGWMDYVPQLRLWLGERYVKNLVARTQTVVNNLYEATLEIPRTKLEDDQFGLYSMHAQMLGREAAIWPDRQIATTIIGAGTGNSYDGVPFFSASHPTDPSGSVAGTQSNLFGLALTAANFQTVRATMRAYLGRDNQPIGVLQSGRGTLMVGPALEGAARQLLQAEYLSPTAGYGLAASGAPTSNVWMGSADLIVNPYITSATAWYYMDLNFPIKPFIWQVRQEPQFVQRTDPGTDVVFERDVYQYGVRARAAASTSLWWLIAQGNT
jgi:phage major head subunit gpT-like protein